VRRYIYRPEVGLVEVTPRRAPAAQVHLQTDAGFDGLRATDGTDISSRTKWERYMKANGLTLTNDFRETWQRAAKEREAAATIGSGSGRAERVETLRRVMDMSPRDVHNIAERARERAASDHYRPTPEGRGWED
jgi:hypothetical protein